MPCTSPLAVYRDHTGKVQFKRPDLHRPDMFRIDCGMCTDCRLSKARDWSLRAAHEAEVCGGKAMFCDLTYANAPSTGVQKHDPRHFLKSLRNGLRYKTTDQIRYFGVGEYGEKFARPHYHVMLFNLGDPKRYFLKKSKKGTNLYRSPLIEKHWKHGYVTVSDFTPEAAAYAARYTMKKITGEAATDHYLRENPDGTHTIQNPEFQFQSMGLGLRWIQKNYREVFARDSVIYNGKEYPVPKYYDRWLKNNHPDLMEEVIQKRVEKAELREIDSGLRLQQKAHAKNVQIKNLKRNYESGRLDS